MISLQIRLRSGCCRKQTDSEAVLAYMQENKVKAYDEKTGKVCFAIFIRIAFASGEIMVCLVINGKKFPEEEKLIEKLKGLVFERSCKAPVGTVGGLAESEMTEKKIVSISISINTEQTNVIMGKEIRTLWGSDYIEDSIRILETEDKVTFRISPLSFYQVNPRQTEKLYSLALSYAELTGEETWVCIVVSERFRFPCQKGKAGLRCRNHSAGD